MHKCITVKKKKTHTQCVHILLSKKNQSAHNKRYDQHSRLLKGNCSRSRITLLLSKFNKLIAQMQDTNDLQLLKLHINFIANPPPPFGSHYPRENSWKNVLPINLSLFFVCYILITLTPVKNKKLIEKQTCTHKHKRNLNNKVARF